ncbi:30S ribosomal protein S1 [Methanobrevibacter cuticularis]|uniref:30S ribosomal protein S1 n=1 Tax=Methanobrevibacter cuticularis TaxID=47311 RepID=A0A166CHC5_9EURY|nr:Tex-like N-terminal domain-containing protein [Methanobrevibacter cuticularis]KZX14508.1 30S ribosomal protein S1 [Methanobrevibacter cuticularis]
MIVNALSEKLNLFDWQVKEVISLISQGYSIPYIVRYKKKETGSLNDETVRKVIGDFKNLKTLEKRKKEVIKSLKEQDKFSDELNKIINNAKNLETVEDIYRPFSPKNRTMGVIAKEKGLEGLAKIILEQKINSPISDVAKEYLSDENGVNTVEEAISGSKDIIAEIISDNPQFRPLIRKISYEDGEIIVKVSNKNEESSYEMYYEHKEKLVSMANHRILAINRGEEEGFLKVKIQVPESEITSYLNRHILIDNSKDHSENYNKFTKELLEETVLRAYRDLIAPSIEKDIRDHLSKKAINGAIKVFSKNLESLLMQGPIRDKIVLGWNPSPYSTSKLAIVDGTGEVLATDNVFTIGSQNQIDETKNKILDLINKYNVDIIALGSVSDSKRFETIIADIIKGTNVKYAIVNQAGASDYSRSIFGVMELPNFENDYRVAISIAKRLQDPLVELVKVDPKSIGVGQYQHDIDEKYLSESLKNVIEKVVNDVGVDVNSASIPLLVYVSGLDSAIATNILKYREENGVFTNRKELLKVEGIDANVFEQCAGFLKVFTSDNLLDITRIHPKYYDVTYKILEELNYKLGDIFSGNLSFGNLNLEKLAKKFDIDKGTLMYIIIQLKYPLKDPRDQKSQAILRSHTLSIENLKEGMILDGSVRNVVDFGAFIDIGVYHDGLIHISHMGHGKFVNHPSDIVNVGDIVKVQIIELDLDRNRIQLTMLDD